MSKSRSTAERFLALHQGEAPLLLPNPSDVGMAKMLASLGFAALATTSGGFAATLGRVDGSVRREEALAHAAAIVDATDLPVSADLENGFGDEPVSVAETVTLAREVGLAGCSIEDYGGTTTKALYSVDLAAERIRAAADAAHQEAHPFVLTGRAENYLHGRPDLSDTIARLQAYQEAGVDVLFAPGLIATEEIRQLVASVDRPVSVLALPGTPSVAELADLGVRRVSVGGSFAFAGLQAVHEAAAEFLHAGTYGYLTQARAGSRLARSVFAQ